MRLTTILSRLGQAVLIGALPLSAAAFETFADEDRSAELSGEPAHQQYQFNTPTTVSYDRDTLSQGAAGTRVYVADMGNHEIKVLNLDGALIGTLDDADQALAPDSPASSVPEIRAPLGIAFLSASEADDDRLAGLYVNDVGRHQIHFFRTLAGAAGDFEYVTSFGQPGHGHGGGEDIYLPRNMVITPQGFIYVSDEFNHRVKAFTIDPDNGYQVDLIQTLGHRDANGDYLGAGPIIRGVDKNYGTDSTHYDDYAGEPDKRDGYRIPQGMTYYQSPDNGATYLYVADNGNNRIKIFRVDTATGQLTLDDMLGRFRDDDGDVDHLKRPRGVRTDLDGNLYVADTYNGRIILFPNLAATTDTDPVRYRSSGSADAEATWVYGRLGIHQVEMRSASATEDEAFQLPNDLVPVIGPDGAFYREDIYSWGYYFPDARVHLVSDSGNNRIKKCWSSSDGDTLLRCSVSEGVGGVADHEFWGHPRTLAGQLHSSSGMAWLDSKSRLLVSDTPNTRINIYDASGNYRGRFPGTDISYGVTGIATFTDPNIGEAVAVLVAADATLPWPYTGDASLRIYDADGNLEELFNLTYRTGGLSVPAIALTSSNTNYPVAVSARSGASPDEHGIFITSFGNTVWRFDYDSGSGTLDGNWYAGGPDPDKGNDLGENWSLGPDFFEQGAAGTFDQIGSVLALDGRVYVTDRRNQRLQALDPASGALIGQLGLGGGTYDHPDSLDPQRFFLPAGLAYDAQQDALLVADGFNMVARAWNNPDAYSPDASGVISPAYRGHWLDPALGTRPGGLFDAEQVAVGDGSVYVFSLISNRVTKFSWSEINP
ncbi:NHL repeat-containing protein [Microbulbifer halophilus]|uniref:NHL repeat-containing protein n=1 Tax=Microbulbifer halophilus TaxID=453963 RepID=A0ABW5EI62_9GAMM|nr:NHL repeat-containing protein [Microbulbifer halophilus]MCW8126219.1 NHL repeat-containing protein [Microbulbifer halophilus]